MLKVKAPAKINLHLEILGRRPDGFHELRTLLQSIDLADELTASETGSPELTLAVEPEGVVGCGEDNLVMRAARLLQECTGQRRGARLTLGKRIPLGAGLGGGSADAAACLVLLDRLWSLDLGALELHRLAAELGSDVPFFLHGGLALGVGRGEEVYPLPDLPQLGLVVAAPPVEVATAAVYGRLETQLTWSPPDGSVYAFAAGLDNELRWKSLRNDLQPVVVEAWPEVAEVVDHLQGCAPLHAAVTGSGAAAFALFADRDSARSVADGMEDRWWVHTGVTLGRSDARLGPVPGKEDGG